MTTALPREPVPLFVERASLPRGRRLTWTLKERGEQAVRIEPRRAIPEFAGQSGLELRTRTACAGRHFLYLRGTFSLEPGECAGSVVFEAELALADAPDVLLAVGLYEDAHLVEKIHSQHEPVPAAQGVTLATLAVDFRKMPVRGQRIFGFIQVCLPRVPGARVLVGRAGARSHAGPAEPTRGVTVFESLRGLVARVAGARRLFGPRIRFEAFGDETVASSRLRVWKLAELLRQDGHDVRVGCGGREDVDVLICQKVRPFATVKGVREANPQAVVVYDFDDNFTLDEQGVLPELLAFVNQVDLVTCGSEYLAERVRAWHPEVHVLENPLDVGSDAPARPARGELKAIGWFGAPEGLVDLARAAIDEPVVTLTRGGDVAYDLATVDADLARFDLVVLPVGDTAWHRAKNANRMMKALALGIPVLASATPEHERVARLTDLPPECLVPSPDGWREGLARVRARYPAVEQATLRARETLLRTHSTRAILEGLMNLIGQVSPAREARASTPAFGRIAAFVVDGSPDGRGLATVEHSRVEWSAFHSAHLFCAKALPPRESRRLRSFQVTSGDYLAAFQAADRALAECEAESLLVIPAGTALGFGIAREIERLTEATTLALFARNGFHSATRVGVYAEPRLAALFLEPVPPGPLLVKTAWAKERAKSWQSTYELWPWATLLQAWASGVPTATVELPFAFDAIGGTVLNPAEQYAAWLAEHRPEWAGELPDLAAQWVRMVTDLVTELAPDLKEDLPWLVGPLYSRYVGARQAQARAERESAKP